MNTRAGAVALIGVTALALATTPALAGKGKPPSGSTTGTGQIFSPNPVVALQDQSLTDQNDADYAALQGAYQIVELTNLDGSGYLRGDWANIVSETGNPAYSPTNTFIYRRNDDRFEQVMAYYWVTETQKYIQSLGFGTGLYAPVNMESQDIRINQWGADNSFSWDKKDMIKLGKGGVDDAEDAEVIIHEYGHAVHDSQVAGFGTSIEAGAIGEGFGDYLAVTVTNVLAPTPDAPCVADWDATSYTTASPHCLRRIDLDIDYAALQGAYEIVELTNLDGSGYLRGDWANIISETGNPAYSPTNTFIYKRNDDRFEQVMAYYWVTQAQLYIQSLGFGTGTYAPVNMESQDLRINQWGADNSYSWDKHDVIRLGKGGVDDAEDADVIVHEYGHAVHDSQVAGFGTSIEAGAIGEAFGDYLAATVTNVVSGSDYEVPCIADWDAVSYTTLTETKPVHCLRRIDTDLTYADRRGRVHYDGQIWSRALWDIRQALGHVKADTVIIQAQFLFAPDTTFAAAADHTIVTADTIVFPDGTMLSDAEVAAVRKAFLDREITVTK
ncbi:MAG TPA: M36 family metallopeptidase [Mycobacteriales bacterium]|nr:M36 family metallopeptidase [Mycobacteriales bacterium]